MDEPIRLQFDDEWHTRDLPVLATTARLLKRDLDLPIGVVVRLELGLTEEEALEAFRALDDGGYLAATIGGQTLGSPGEVFAVHLRERGRRAIGLWPSERGVENLEEALRRAEATTSDPEERSAIRRALGAVTGVSREVMVDVMASVIMKQSGLG